MKEGAINFAPSFYLIPQTKNPTSVMLDVVERVNLFKQYHLPYFPERAATKAG